MHILILPSWYPSKMNPVRGIFFKEQALALAKSGLKVGVIYPELHHVKSFVKNGLRFGGGLHKESDQEIVKTYRFSELHSLYRFEALNNRHWFRLGEKLFKLYETEEGKPDIIHAHSALLAGSLASHLKRKFDIPYLLTEHSNIYAMNKLKDSRRELATEAFQNASLNIAVSPQLGQTIKEKICADIQFKWIPNLVSDYFESHITSKEILAVKRQRLNFQSDCTFLNVALMTEKKGQFDLIESFSKAFSKHDKVELYIGGEGPLLPKLKEKVIELNLQNRIFFLGRLTRQEVAQHMLNSDVFILSSHYETFGVVLVEALACGTPVIATKCGGPECIVNSSNGILVNPKNIEQLVEAMLYMKDHKEQYDPLALRRECLNRFSERAIVRELKKSYAKIFVNK